MTWWPGAVRLRRVGHPWPSEQHGARVDIKHLHLSGELGHWAGPVAVAADHQSLPVAHEPPGKLFISSHIGDWADRSFVEDENVRLLGK